jgi:uncharacterized membrane protein
MTVGPVQVIVFGFERTDQFRGEVLGELANLRGRGLLRLIDLFLAVKDLNGKIVAAEVNDLTKDESVEFGKVIGKLLGISGESALEMTADVAENMLTAAFKSVGLNYQGLQNMVNNLEPGKAFGILMFEHTWAIPLRDAIRRAGGVPLTQGFITQEALVLIGEELQAIAEAERTIEVSRIVQSAAILDTLATLQEAEALKTAITADVLRTLAVAELIDDAAVADAIDALASQGLLEAKYLEAAAQVEAQDAEVDKAFFAASE